MNTEIDRDGIKEQNLEGIPTKIVESQTKAYNLLWLSPRFPQSNEGFVEPIGNTTIENIYGIAKKNQNVEVRLWIDSIRMTGAQIGWLEEIMK